MKKYFLPVIFLFAFTAQLFAQQKPNIVFMLADDCSSWDLEPYGSKDAITPALNQLAKEGMLFTKCYQSSPMCSPTRQNILTGMSPFRTGAYPNHTNVDSNIKSIASYLRPLGYRVALGGKQHYGPAKNFPLEYLGREKGNALDPDFSNIDTFLQAVSSKNQPFCLFICSNQPHTPWNKGNPSLFNKDTLKLPPFYADLPKTREGFRNYLAEINYLDAQVKQALDLLEKHHLSDNTIFVFASEQGNSFPFAKWTCYNIGLKSALIVRWPGKVRPNTISDALVEYSDITPTFIDIAGGKPVAGLDGSSIVPVLTQQKTSHKQYTFGQMTTRGIVNGSDYFPIRSVSNGRYRYIINLTPDIEFSNAINNNAFFKEWIKDAEQNPHSKLLVQKHLYRPGEELYDDEKDPYNQHNLVKDASLRTVKADLKKHLKEWMEHTGDKGIITELLAFEHMPGKASHTAVIIDTIMHKPIQIKNALQFTVSKDGYYTFYVDEEGGIEVDNVLLVDETITGNKHDRYGVIGLKKGVHSIILTGTTPDAVSYSGPATGRIDLNGKPKGKKASDDE